MQTKIPQPHSQHSSLIKEIHLAGLNQALAKLNFTQLTPVQKASIPAATQGKDLVAQAQTGSGKTAAYLLPLIQFLDANAKAVGLVLAPTREVALQIFDVAKTLTQFVQSVKPCAIIGGAPMGVQLNNLKRNPRLIIGTPGRINDIISQKALPIGMVKFLILDEADQMFDMGFLPQIERIMFQTAQDRQTMMFSATMPISIKRLIVRHMKKPEWIAVGTQEQAPKTLRQHVIIVPLEEKLQTLQNVLSKPFESALVFAQTQHGVEKLCNILLDAGFSARSIHGGLRQSQRLNSLRSFKSGATPILIATDVAARGLDIPIVSLVVNFDLPQVVESFLHRVGRTARNGAEGKAVTIVSDEDFRDFAPFRQYLNDATFEGEFQKAKFSARPKSRSGGAKTRGPKNYAPQGSRFQRREANYTNNGGRPNNSNRSNSGSRPSNESQSLNPERVSQFGTNTRSASESRGRKPTHQRSESRFPRASGAKSQRNSNFKKF